MVPPGAPLRLMAVRSFVAVVRPEQPGTVGRARDRNQGLGRGWFRWEEENSPAEPSQGWLDQGHLGSNISVESRSLRNDLC
jgi:hypothetical protein